MPLRRDASTTVLALLALAGLIAGCSEVQAKRPRNVVIIALDTLRPDHLGCYGHSRPTSPAIDRFASESFVFENAHAPSPWTAPSLISLMTALEPEVHQVLGAPNPGRLDDKVTTLAEILKARGFATAAFTEGGYAKGRFGLDQGFDEYDAHAADAADAPVSEPRESGLDANVERSIAWLRARRDRPFLLFFHTYEPHMPYRAHESFVSAFRPGFDAVEERTELARIIGTWNEERTLAQEDCAFVWPRALFLRSNAMWKGLPEIESPDDFARAAGKHGFGRADSGVRPEIRDLMLDLYDAGIASADRGVAKLLAALEELGLDEDTLVVIVSDHGEGLGEHGQLEHGFVLHEEILRVVLLVRTPESRVAPRRIGDLVGLVDVAPTVLDLLRIDPRKLPMQGRSLLPALRGALPEASTLAHGRTIARDTDALYSLRTSAWRLNFDMRSGQTWLWDRARDPREEVDVAAANPLVVEALRAQILRRHALDVGLRNAIAGDTRVEALDAATIRELSGLGYGGDVPKEQ
jgi:arylsulfatase A-like enzyme